MEDVYTPGVNISSLPESAVSIPDKASVPLSAAFRLFQEAGATSLPEPEPKIRAIRTMTAITMAHTAATSTPLGITIIFVLEFICTTSNKCYYYIYVNECWLMIKVSWKAGENSASKHRLFVQINKKV